MNPTLRGFLIVALIALVVVALELYRPWPSLYGSPGSRSSSRSRSSSTCGGGIAEGHRNVVGPLARVVFYGAAILIVLDLASTSRPRRSMRGSSALAFILVLGHLRLLDVRVWRDEHRYGVRSLGLDAARRRRGRRARRGCRTCWPTKIGVSRSV